ncbi:hypothetical protein L210DRAFT_981816 [Boletus edulis BED1]|uniref:Uncharacterized protein n=1 Tax=Boletus edulis BED1 TaxID=1328754 RepID=A0AAD4BTC6_BOLED|nr:hypothetical protein L210DRAFT_981816 [Boletus edulis BED1]
MAFSNLHRIDINVFWFVELTNEELLRLASVWPRLEELLINENSGWSAGGITLNGLVQLLQTSRFLRKVALTINMHSFMDFNQLTAILGLTLPPTFSLNVLDSLIDEDSVPTMATLLACIASDSDLSLWVFCMDTAPDHCACWHGAFQRAQVALGQEYSLFTEIDCPHHRLYRFSGNA